MFEFTVTKFLPEEVPEVFKYFSEAKLLQKWASPEGMTLRVPQFEARTNGRYRYEHTHGEGTYVCEGRVQEFVPNRKILQIDKFIKNPEGKVIQENISSLIYFESQARGTNIAITSSGFKDEKSKDECERGWNECLDKLLNLLSGKQFRQTESWDETRGSLN